MIEVRAAQLWAVIAATRRFAAHAPRTPSATKEGPTLYLVSATSHLAEGWRDRAPCLELAGDAVLEPAVRAAAATLDLDLTWESPADVIPLPHGWESRARPVTEPLGQAQDAAGLLLRHFDPYSVVLRLVARGDEPDYVAGLEYVRNGWVDPKKLESLLDDLLPRFTRATLAQDPAEFRRKFRGLRQLINAIALTGSAAKAIIAPPPNAADDAWETRENGWISSPTS